MKRVIKPGKLRKPIIPQPGKDLSTPRKMGNKQRVRLRMRRMRTKGQHPGNKLVVTQTMQMLCQTKCPKRKKAAHLWTRAGPERGKEAEGPCYLESSCLEGPGTAAAMRGLPCRREQMLHLRSILYAEPQQESIPEVRRICAARQWSPMTKHMTTWSFWKRLGHYTKARQST